MAGSIETKNPSDLLRRVYKYCYLLQIKTTSPESQNDDDDVTL